MSPLFVQSCFRDTALTQSSLAPQNPPSSQPTTSRSARKKSAKTWVGAWRTGAPCAPRSDAAGFSSDAPARDGSFLKRFSSRLAHPRVGSRSPPSARPRPLPELCTDMDRIGLHAQIAAAASRRPPPLIAVASSISSGSVCRSTPRPGLPRSARPEPGLQQLGAKATADAEVLFQRRR